MVPFKDICPCHARDSGRRKTAPMVCVSLIVSGIRIGRSAGPRGTAPVGGEDARAAGEWAVVTRITCPRCRPCKTETANEM